MALEQIRKELEEIKSDLMRERSRLSSRRAAPYFRRFAGLFFDFSQNYKRSEESGELYREIFYGMSKLSKKVEPKSKRLVALLGGDHGIAKTTEVERIFSAQAEDGRWSPKWNYIFSKNIEWSRGVIIYNGFHWLGLARMLGDKEPVRKRTLLLPEGKIGISKGGKIKFETGAFRETLLSIPHIFEEYHFRDRTQLEFSGKREFTPERLFVLLRTVSNAFHVQQLDVGLKDLKNRLNEKGLSTGEFLEGFKKNGRFVNEVFGYPAPYHANRTLETALLTIERMNLPLSTALEAVDKAQGKPKIRIELKPGSITVRNTGFGLLWKERISKFRWGGGTSGYLQKKIAEITRDVADGETVTKINFNRKYPSAA